MKDELDTKTLDVFGGDKLAAAGIVTRDELAELTVDELMDITGQNSVDAMNTIIAARAHWFEDAPATAAKWSTNDKKRIDPNWPFKMTIGTPEQARAAAATLPRSIGFRERERLKRKAARWTAKLRAMPATERAFIRAALDGIAESGEA